jgi:hypothetical protein
MADLELGGGWDPADESAVFDLAAAAGSED